jgi:hypothetical protein
MKNVGSQLILLAAYFFSIIVSIATIKHISKQAIKEKKQNKNINI